MADGSDRGKTEEASMAHGMWKCKKLSNAHGTWQTMPWNMPVEKTPKNFQWTGNSPTFVKPTSTTYMAGSVTSTVPKTSTKEKRLWKHVLDKKKTPGVTFTSMSVLEWAPATHTFKTEFQPAEPKKFFNTVRKEMALLSTSLPEGIMVKTFEDRMDIFSALIKGPTRTPYEDGLFLFDIQLPNTYPLAPPRFHYLSQCSGRLNPNLYDNGTVCVSLLGTWSGHGTEIWTNKSNLMQVLISIQGLILVNEPYYNEPGFASHPKGNENSRLYNEMTLIKVVQSMTRLLQAPIEAFSKEIQEHFCTSGWRLVHRLEDWLELNESAEKRRQSFYSFPPKGNYRGSGYPDIGFPLFPLSGAWSVQSALSQYRAALVSAGISEHTKDNKYAAKKTVCVDGDTRPTAKKNRGNSYANVSANYPNTGPAVFTAFDPYAPVGNTAGNWAHDPYYNTGPPISSETPSQYWHQTIWQQQQRYNSSTGQQLNSQQQINMQPHKGIKRSKCISKQATMEFNPPQPPAWNFQSSSASFQKQAGATQQYLQTGNKQMNGPTPPTHYSMRAQKYDFTPGSRNWN